MAHRPEGKVTQIRRQKLICIYYMSMMCAPIRFIQQYSMSLLSNNDVRNAFFTFVECIDGVLKFTLEPPNPSYVLNESNAKLVWDYSVDNQAELLGIIYSVKEPSGAFAGMLVKLTNGSVIDHQSIPAAYKGRVRIEGRASLVIDNVTPQENTEFKCALVPNSGRDLESKVQLIVKGT